MGDKDKPPIEHRFSSTNQPKNRGRKKGGKNKVTRLKEYLKLLNLPGKKILEMKDDMDLPAYQIIDCRDIVSAFNSSESAKKRQMEYRFGKPEEQINLNAVVKTIEIGLPPSLEDAQFPDED